MNHEFVIRMIHSSDPFQPEIQELKAKLKLYVNFFSYSSFIKLLSLLN